MRFCHLQLYLLEQLHTWPSPVTAWQLRWLNTFCVASAKGVWLKCRESNFPSEIKSGSRVFARHLPGVLVAVSRGAEPGALFFTALRSPVSPSGIPRTLSAQMSSVTSPSSLFWAIRSHWALFWYFSHLLCLYCEVTLGNTACTDSLCLSSICLSSVHSPNTEGS